MPIFGQNIKRTPVHVSTHSSNKIFEEEKKMRKFFAILLCTAMLTAIAACGKSEKEYKLGMGVSVSFEDTAETNAQVDATVAAVILDAEGKIAYCRIDATQNKMDVTDGAVDAAASYKSKMELGDDYNMKKYRPEAVGEWYEQAQAFEAYCVGKTAEEIENIPTQISEQDGRVIAADEALLAGCTIQIDDFRKAVVKACKDKWAVSFKTAGEITLGVAVTSEASQSTAATAEEDGSVKMYSEFAAAAMVDGRIAAALNDAIQPQIAIDANGIIADGIIFSGTKRELGAGYNMVKYSDAIAEWDAQSAAFSNYVIGMTASEVENIEIQIRESDGYEIAKDEKLLAGCTISITGLKAIVAKAAKNAR